MRKLIMTICALSVAALAAACGSDSTPAANTAAATTGGGGTSVTIPGGGGASTGAGTASVDIGGDKIDFTGITCVVAPGDTAIIVNASKGADTSFSLTADATTAGKPVKGGGKFDKFAVAVIKGTSIPVAVVSGSLNLAADLRSGDFSGKDSASSRTVSGKFAC